MIEVLTLSVKKFQQSSVKVQNISVEQDQAVVDGLARFKDLSVCPELGQKTADLCKDLHDFSEGRSEGTSHLRIISH
jgi:hypothetical protein